MIEFHAASVPEFMRALVVSEPHFPAKYWFFRGQANLDWKLAPSARREQSWQRFGGVDRLGLQVRNGLVISSNDDLRAVELSVLETLTQVVDRMGLAPNLAGDPAREVFAQHIGLPTRLLDWTRSPWTAAYFAASGAVHNANATGKLVVYAVSTLFLNQAARMLPVEHVKVGAAGNANLVAQQGVLLRVPGDTIDLLDGIPTESKAIGYRPTETEGRTLENHFVRVTLPWSSAPALLQLLRAQEVHAATLFPGNAGIAELIREVFVGGAG